MAILSRKTLKVFASAAADIGQFGSGALGTKVITTDPTVVQALSAWVGGWLVATLGANKFPPLEEMNGVAFVATYSIAYLFQEGIPEYDAGTTYSQFGVVKKAGTYDLYGSAVTNNVGNALTDPTKWTLLGALTSLNNTTAVKSEKVTRITSSGTWTVDANNLYSKVRMVGGGGGSGGNPGSTGTGGGGAAGYLEFNLTKAQAGASQAATIGAAGALGASGSNNGGAGGTTSLGSLASCTGGNGSTTNVTGGSQGNFAIGGTGGAPTLTTGTLIASRNGQQGGTGGQGATSTGGICTGGYGGSGPLGDGGAQIFTGNPPSTTATSQPGTGFGSGGGGSSDSSGVASAGVAGQPGLIIIIEYLSV